RRHIDQQAVDPAVCDGLQMLSNGIEVPAVHIGRVRFDDVPRLADEARKRLAALPDAFGILGELLALPLSPAPLPLRPDLRQRGQADRGWIRACRVLHRSSGLDRRYRW